MQFALRKVSVLFPSAVGIINQARKQRLAQLLGSEFPILGEPEGIPALHYIDPKTHDIVMVESGRIVLSREAEPFVDAPDLGQWGLRADRVFSELLLDAPAEFVLLLEGTLPTEKDTMIASQALVANIEQIKGALPNLKGIGLRLMLEDTERGAVKGEFKFEPLIADPSRFFVQYIKGMAFPGSFDKALKIVEHELSQFITLSKTLGEYYI